MFIKKDFVKKADLFYRKHIPKSRPKEAYIRHVELVRKYALLLGKKYDANLFIIELAALLHDIGADAGQSHALKSVELAAELLSDFKIDKKNKAKILSAIRNHSMSHSSGGFKRKVVLEDQIIRDADTLSFLKDTYIAYFKEMLRREPPPEKAKQVTLEKIRGMLNKVGTNKGKECAKKLYAKAEKHILNF